MQALLYLYAQESNKRLRRFGRSMCGPECPVETKCESRIIFSSPLKKTGFVVANWNPLCSSCSPLGNGECLFIICTFVREQSRFLQNVNRMGGLGGLQLESMGCLLLELLLLLLLEQLLLLLLLLEPVRNLDCGPGAARRCPTAAAQAARRGDVKKKAYSLRETRAAAWLSQADEINSRARSLPVCS